MREPSSMKKEKCKCYTNKENPLKIKEILSVQMS